MMTAEGGGRHREHRRCGGSFVGPGVPDGPEWQSPHDGPDDPAPTKDMPEQAHFRRERKSKTICASATSGAGAETVGLPQRRYGMVPAKGLEGRRSLGTMGP